MTSVREQMESLRFVGQHVETAYLNEERVHDRFTGSIGAISEWVATASTSGGGKVGLPLLGLEGQAATSDDVTYNISDPMAQALLLHASLENRRMIKTLDKADELEYVLISGDSCFRLPSLPGTKGHTEACEPTNELEGRRADAEQIYQVFDPAAKVWLLMTQLSGGGRAAATAHQRWIHDGVIPRFSHRRWSTFGVLEDRIGDVPLITPIFTFVEYPRS